MSCKIADVTQITEPIGWRVAGGRGNSAVLSDSPVRGRHSSADARHIETAPTFELESQRQLETTQIRQAAFQEGLHQGREEAAAEVRNATDRLARTLQDLAQVKKKIRSEAEQEVVKLSLAIARRILYRELSTDPESIQGIVVAALQKLQNREISRVRVYPAGAPAVRAALERIGVSGAPEVVQDASLASGALLFETVLGELDASVETQLQEIQRGFADRLNAR
jgi:flagellar assembly protein FliH